MKIRFYKELDGRWYADLPAYIAAGGSKEDCEMVAGADRWLSVLAGKENSITLDISKTSGDHKLTLAHLGYELSDDDFMEYGGATYRPGVIEGEDHSWRTVWLCAVTLFVLGEYPNTIYYTVTDGETDGFL